MTPTLPVSVQSTRIQQEKSKTAGSWKTIGIHAEGSVSVTWSTALVWSGPSWGAEAGAGGKVLSAHTLCCPGGLSSGTGTSEISPSTEMIAGFFSWVTEIHFQPFSFQVSLECTTKKLKIVNGSRVRGRFLSHTRVSFVWLLVHFTRHFLDSGAEAWLMCCEQNHADLSLSFLA